MKEGVGENEYSYANNSPTNHTDPLGLYTGEGGGYNSFNDMGPVGQLISWYLDGDQIAKDGWTLGNWCAPLSERIWAGLRLGWTIFINTFGAKLIGKGLGLLWKRVPC